MADAPHRGSKPNSSSPGRADTRASASPVAGGRPTTPAPRLRRWPPPSQGPRPSTSPNRTSDRAVPRGPANAGHLTVAPILEHESNDWPGRPLGDALTLTERRRLFETFDLARDVNDRPGESQGRRPRAPVNEGSGDSHTACPRPGPGSGEGVPRARLAQNCSAIQARLGVSRFFERFVKTERNQPFRNTLGVAQGVIAS